MKNTSEAWCNSGVCGAEDKIKDAVDFRAAETGEYLY